MSIEPVIADLILYPDKDQQGAGHAYRKTADIDKRKPFSTEKIAPGNG
jgi:hypothetical protein